jgi:hypothetical protein
VNILQGLRAVALASGFKRGEFIGDTNLSPTIIRWHHHHRVAHENIKPPHITIIKAVCNKWHGIQLETMKRQESGTNIEDLISLASLLASWHCASLSYCLAPIFVV